MPRSQSESATGFSGSSRRNGRTREEQRRHTISNGVDYGLVGTHTCKCRITMCVKVFPGGATPLCQQKNSFWKSSNEPALSWFWLFKPATHPSICSYRCISHFPLFFLKKKASLIALQTEKIDVFFWSHPRG